MSTPRQERRRSARLAVSHAVKMQCVETGKYLAGRMRDLSRGGALVEVAHPSLLVPGQQLRLGIAWGPQQVVLHEPDLVEATVVRSLGMGGGQRVAVCFAHEQELAAAG